MKDISYSELEQQMIYDRCNHQYFERVRKIKPTAKYNKFERLQSYMVTTKAIASGIFGTAGYFLGNHLAQQTFDENITAKVIGGLTALAFAKLIAKPASRAGLDLGLRTNQS